MGAAVVNAAWKGNAVYDNVFRIQDLKQRQENSEVSSTDGAQSQQ